MASMLDTLRAKRDAGEISTSSTGVKVAGEGHFTVQVTSADWGKNRAGDAEQGKISFKVIAVRKDTPADDVGAVFSEYVSLKNEEMAEKKYLQISDWLKAAGVKDEKMVDEDDDGLGEAMRTLVLALQKYSQKKEITVDVYRKASDKTDSQGRPYYNNYFNDPFAEASDDDKREANEAKQLVQQAAQQATSPYKTAKADSKHAVADDED